MNSTFARLEKRGVDCFQFKPIRCHIMKLLKCTLMAITLLSTQAVAQTTGGPLALKDRAVDKQLIELEAAAKDLKDAGISTKGRLEGGIFSVNVRHIQGAEAVHQHCFNS